MVIFQTHSKLYYLVIPESVNKMFMYSTKYDYCENFRFLLQPEDRDNRLLRHVCTYPYNTRHYIPADGMRYTAISGFQIHIGIEVVPCFKHVRYRS
jgi:hypothetical protein